MRYIDSIEGLEALYGTPPSAALRKVARRMTPLYRRWIMASRLCVLTTVGPEGTDGSPRGDDGPVVQELDPGTLAMPDWRGNNRLDSLRNIVRDPRVSLMFFVPGSNTVVRVNGAARVTTDAGMRARFDKGGRQPATVIVIAIDEIYAQCARALMRAGTWTRGDETAGLPSVGAILAEMTDGEEGGKPYDDAWGARAARTMW
ncbi:pyridoxamine 5'-phosphate oxidase family protein [Antarcticimicrobium luteum]|uniref:Pyridoxamine 5'-phosphate oxidase family protein n=1 Tax=Antarcticimicrobium luteum TaxID=2547397 RepID=A0A4R5UTD2_9RHOB|nr:pyridoxamine 5'-phosphate oxidase family protein [Antarcticimicrobium luteum]TDK42301.1 pyridoxamine 5'-phosphate oxidase family protein [Antarcticimicrobium luteum]